MNKKRWTRKIIGRVAIAIITMVLVLLLISTARSKMQEYTSGIFKEDVSEYAGNTQDVQENEVVGPTCESAADMVSYLDGTYTRYLGADT